MEYLIIYDNSGFVISRMSGIVHEPVGVPFLYTTVPDGKYVSSIDVSVTPNAPILSDYPKSEVQLLKEQITSLQAEIDILTGGTTA